jgi:DNA-binding response OmpR family regulator
MGKILIVEDDPSMSSMYKRIFTLEGYEVEVAEDGEQGLQKAAALPEIILLDIMMPKMNGLEVLDRLKSDPTTKAIPVIILTNLGNEKDAETSINKGALEYLIKSEHEPEEIVNVVKGILFKNSNQTPQPAN